MENIDSRLSEARKQLAPFAGIGSGFLSVSQAAAISNTGQETIRRGIRAGRIPAFGSRGRLRVRLVDVMPQYAPQRKGAQ